MKKHTILDIAKLAKVSKSTISRVINNEPGVKEETKLKILKIIEEYDYTPSKSARELRGIKINAYGVLMTRLESNSENQAVRGIIKKLYENNYDYLILENRFSIEKTKHYIEDLLKRGIDGLIIFALPNENYNFLKKIKKSVVMIGQEVEGFNSIVYDDYGAVTKILDYLWKNGKRKIAYIGIDRNDPTTGEKRYRAYEEFSKDKKMKNISYFGNFEYKSGFSLGEEAMKNDIDSIVCGTDNLALGVKEYLRQKNNKKVIVTGIGNDKLVRFLDPEHISINFSYEESGKKAVEILVDQKSDKTKNYTYNSELILENVLDKS